MQVSKVVAALPADTGCNQATPPTARSALRRLFIAAALTVVLVAVGTKVYAGTPYEGAAVSGGVARS